MTSEEIRQLAYTVYEAVNNRDIDKITTLFAPNIIRHAMGETGLEAAKRAIQSLPPSSALHFVVKDVLVDGDKAALRVEVEDASQPKNQPGLVIMEIFRIENGKVAEIWGAGSVPKQMRR